MKRVLAHIGYVVPEIKRALKRFMKEGAVVVISPAQDPIQKVEVCLLRIDGTADIELIAPLDVNDNPVKGRLGRGGGLDHICYFVDDIEKALEKEKSIGGIVVCKPCYAVAFHRTVAFVHRKSGLVVEFMSNTALCNWNKED